MEKKAKKTEIINFYQQLDRSFFVDNEYKKMAYCDHPLPIGFNQTISQPSLVLEMTIALELDKSCRVLEIGTGSGYQTALLARFAGSVYTVERIEELAQKARDRLLKLGYNNIYFKTGDGSKGWPENAPYDRIMVTAAASSIPAALLKQLSQQGKLLIPVGSSNCQELMLLSKEHDERIVQQSLGEVRFVEFVGKYGWTD